MILHELTLDQQTFAENNHGIVYRFLRLKKLPRDDYYDVVVFGYLRAVRDYCTRPDLRDKYEFSTIAWRKMRDDLAKHYEKKCRLMRKAITVSLENLLRDSETLTLADVIGDSDPKLDNIEAKLLWEQIAGLLTEEQIETLRLRADGYTDRQIAVKRRLCTDEIENTFRDIQMVVKDLCLA